MIFSTNFLYILSPFSGTIIHNAAAHGALRSMKGIISLLLLAVNVYSGAL